MLRRLQPWLAAVGLLAWLPVMHWAQAPAVRFDNWTTDNGLPQNTVRAITQTRDGYLWMGTYNGLARFDGVRFTVFDKSNTKAFSNNRVSDLYEDGTGALWISIVQGGVLRYHQGSFTAFTHAHGLPHNNIMMGMRSSPGGVPLIFTDAGAVWWRDGRFVPYEVSGSPDELQMYYGHSGTHWLVDKHGLHARQDGRRVDYTLPVALGALSTLRFYEDRSGALWLAAPPHGLFKAQAGRVTDYTQRLKLRAPVAVTGMLEDVDGSFWFGTNNAGLIHFKEGGPRAELSRYTTAQGLSSNGISRLLQDRENNLWIGTDGGGLNRLTRQFISGYSEAQGLAGNIAHSVLEDRAGNIWVATQAGLSRISHGVVTNYLPGKTPGSLPLQPLQTLHEDRSGRLWIGGWNGLCLFKDKVFSLVIPQLNVHAMREDGQGNLWLGTHHGLIKYKDGVQTLYRTQDGLPNDVIRVIHEDRNGALWLGTDGGLVKYAAGQFSVFTTQNGLSSDYIWSIHEDAEGVLWLGSFDGGLMRFKDGRFTSFTMAQGLYNNGVFQILEDGRGNLWMSCYRGIYSVSKQQLNDFAAGKLRAINSTAYGKADGLLAPDCNGSRQPSGVKDRDGRLWFATLKGVAVVNPEGVVINALPPPVQIEEVMIDNAPADTQVGSVRTVRLLPGQTNLEIRYTGLSFIKPGQLRFRYKLTGQDQHWTDAGSQRSVTYPYLPPGNYTFQVLAANSDGVWNESDARLRIVVVPPFYRTWWFMGLALLSLVGLAFTAYRWRIRQLRREQQQQVEFSRRLIEAHESERGRLAGELHDSLGQDLLVIKNWALVGLTTTPEDNPAREMLAEITEATAHAIEDCREISHNLRPHQLDFIGLTEALRAMINKVANSSGLQIDAQLDDLTGTLPKEAEINLYRIVQESLNNIVKHARATQVKIAVQKTHVSAPGRAPRTIIYIEDNGRGFDPVALSNGKRGLGLSSITERARMLGGEVSLKSAPGRGTVVTVTLDSL